MERPRAPGKFLFFAHDLDHKTHFGLIGLVIFELIHCLILYES